MTQFDSAADLSLFRLEQSDISSISPDVLEHPEFRLITRPDEWFAVAYDLLAAQFQSDVLDPLERYVEWLELNRIKKHPFPYLMMVSYCRVQGRALLLGILSGNIMKIEEYVSPNPEGAGDPYIFAIGHQVTEPAIRKRKVKGIGTKLWTTATNEATVWIRQLSGQFWYSVLEAEKDSVGFWSKLGYLSPEGVRYWQPPLEFDESGQYLRPEVQEILMLRPTEPAFKDSIDRKFLQNIIATIYLNWSLEKYKRTLSSSAKKKAKDHVMGYLFGRVCTEMPATNFISLIRWPQQ